MERSSDLITPGTWQNLLCSERRPDQGVHDLGNYGIEGEESQVSNALRLAYALQRIGVMFTATPSRSCDNHHLGWLSSTHEGAQI